MHGTEATPLIRGRAPGSGPRARWEEEDGGEHSRRTLQSSKARPRWTPDRVFLATLGCAMAIAAGFISATQTIERFRQPSQVQQQQQQQQQLQGGVADGEGGGGGGGGRPAGGNELASATPVSNELLPAAAPPRLGIFTGPEGLTTSKTKAQQQQQTTQPEGKGISIPPPSASAATAVHGMEIGDYQTDNSGSGQGLDGGVVGGGEGDGTGAVRSDGQRARAGGGWRSNGISKNSGQHFFHVLLLLCALEHKLI